MGSFSLGTWPQFQHVGSSSPTRDRTHAPLHWEHGVLAIGAPGKSPRYFFNGDSNKEFKKQLCIVDGNKKQVQFLFSEGIFGNIYYNFTVAGIIFLALVAFLNKVISKNETKYSSWKRESKIIIIYICSHCIPAGEGGGEKVLQNVSELKQEAGDIKCKINSLSPYTKQTEIQWKTGLPPLLKCELYKNHF